MNNPNHLQVPVIVPSQTSDLDILDIGPLIQSSTVSSPQTPQPTNCITDYMYKDVLYKPDNVAIEPKVQLDVNNDDFKRTESIQSNASSDWSFCDLLGRMSIMEEQSIFMKNGYKKLNKLCDTLQGQLFKAQRLSDSKYVVIKKTNKELHNNGEAIQDDMSFLVGENIIKESLLLKYLTIENSAIGDHIINFIDFFQTEEDYFLVMEYIESEMNLKQFIQLSHRFIKQGKLKLKRYQKIIKYLYWQLIVTIRWLHSDMNLTHLDLCCENIMLKNCTFQKKDNTYIISNDISIKLADFGVAELFETKDFSCSKSGLSLENESYLAPKVYHNAVYNAKSCDMWSLGMILFECMCGKPLYDPEEILINAFDFDSDSKIISGYVSLYSGRKQLKKYLQMTKLSKFFTTDAFDLLINLLELDDTNRFNATNVLKHNWFRLYFKNYAKLIEKKSKSQSVKCLKQKAKMVNFPYYQRKIKLN